MTYTLAAMEVSTPAYVEIKKKLLAAGYGHTIMDDGGLDMTHIALIQKDDEPEVNQILFALDRTEKLLRSYAMNLMQKKDYNAEFFAEDADRILEAIDLLRGNND